MAEDRGLTWKNWGKKIDFKRFIPMQLSEILPKIMVGERRFELPTS